MQYRSDRRSEFWVSIYDDERSSYNIYTNEKYIEIINYFFPQFVDNSPKGWQPKIDKVNLWLPYGRYEDSDIRHFSQWCHLAVEQHLWLGLNKHIEGYFTDELDYCVIPDFNFKYENGNLVRTVTGEAEYQLKYHIDDLYQSGATIWNYAKYLKGLGAKKVMGVVGVKSLRDSDNQ